MSSQLSEICQKIVSGETFKNYDSGKRLLSYLCEQAELGEVPKETTIGVNLFDTDRSKTMDSAKVRVYIHNLRKKLSEYYETEGKDDPYELVIPIGAYKPEIIARNHSKSASHRKKQYVPYVLGVLLIIACVLIYNYYLQKPEHNQETKLPNVFFEEVIKSERPVLVVLGDMFIFSERNKHTGEIQTVRNPNINSDADFRNYLASRNDSLFAYEKMTYSFLVGGSADWVKELTRLFESYDKEFSIRVNSRVQAQDLHDNNIIFVGLQKTAGIFNNYFEISPFLFQEGRGYRHIANDDTVTYISHGNPDALHTDYGFISRYKGPRNNTIFMFGGLWDTSVSQALKQLTDPRLANQTAQKITDELGTLPDQFEILLEVDGMDRTDLNAEILMINEVAF